MAAIDSVYNYYLSTYGNSTTSRYDSHKRSELRNICNNITKLNKESPLYKIKDEGGDIEKFIIDVKESARNVNNVIASLTADSDSIEAAFKKKVAASTQSDIVSANYVGENADADNTEDFEMEVRQLAKPQVNLGNYLTSTHSDIAAGNYSFDLTNLASSYEFQFSVNDGDSNISVQQKLANLLNRANIGLTASVLESDDGTSALQIESAQTGLGDDEDYIFNISAQPNTPAAKTLDALGIDHISQSAQNSAFTLNGVEHSSYSNTFTINRSFELTLNGISNPEDDAVTIGFKPNVDAISDNVQQLVDSYNSIIQTAQNYDESTQQSHRLQNDVASVAFASKNDLESIGLNVNDNGSISVDKNVLYDAIEQDDSKEIFSVLTVFKDALSSRSQEASLNPMKYVDKVIVAYKNPGRNFATPYISSIYSGMMLDSYC